MHVWNKISQWNIIKQPGYIRYTWNETPFGFQQALLFLSIPYVLSFSFSLPLCVSSCFHCWIFLRPPLFFIYHWKKCGICKNYHPSLLIPAAPWKTAPPQAASDYLKDWWCFDLSILSNVTQEEKNNPPLSCYHFYLNSEDTNNNASNAYAFLCICANQSCSGWFVTL